MNYFLSFGLCLFSLGALYAQTAKPPVDVSNARRLYDQRQRGGTLTNAQRADLERERLLAERRKKAVSVRPPGQRSAPEALTPLTDLNADARYEGQDGGLYGKGLNSPPETHRKIAEAELARLQPRNRDGEPDQAGVIGFVAISMSNATQEFSRFKEVADESPAKSPKVIIVDCAQGGQAMAEWAPADAAPWREALRRLEAARVSPQQVQVAWVKLANKSPTGSFQEHAHRLERDTLSVLHNAKRQFPNLRVAYLGSRTYGGYAQGALNPEPYAYESAFAARWLIQRQIDGDNDLALEKTPLLLWGPYLWADGTRGRKVDQLLWTREDFAGDGVHPSIQGRQKVADLLLNFFTTDPMAREWFARR